MSAALHRYAQEAAEARGISKGEVLGRSRNGLACQARAEVMRRLISDGLSFVDVGHLIGRHHTTVLHSLGRLSR